MSSGHICQFDMMQVKSALMDEIMKDPENPSEDLVGDMDIKVGREGREGGRREEGREGGEGGREEGRERERGRKGERERGGSTSMSYAKQLQKNLLVSRMVFL